MAELDTLIEIIVQGYVRRECAQISIEDIVKLIINFEGTLSSNDSLYAFRNGLNVKDYFNKRCVKPLFSPFHVSNHGSNTLILDLFGNVWDCGYSIVGNGNDNGCVQVPQKLCVKQKVIDVSVGVSHGLLLCINGWVKSFGASGHGALGQGHLNVALVPKTIASLKKCRIMQISCGRLHSTALTDSDELFLWGFNGAGQCGQSEDGNFMISIPTKLDFDKKVLLVECGNDHNLLITAEHLIYSFGDEQGGALGRLNFDKHAGRPMLIEALAKKKIIKCAAGGQHSLCIDEEGIVWSFGCNNYGQLGLGHKLNQNTPQIIKWFVSNDIKAKECAAGGYQSAIICQDWNLYVFGGNEFFKHKMKFTAEQHTPAQISLPSNLTIKRISVGHEHTSLIC